MCLASCSTAFAQTYFSGPFGPDGTYNLYEFVGRESELELKLSEKLPRYDLGEQQSRQSVSYEEAVELSRSRVETFTGQSIPGHLVTIGSAEENELMNVLGVGFIGLTNKEVFLDEGAVANPGEDGRFWITGEPRTFTPHGAFPREREADGATIHPFVDGNWFESSRPTRNYIVEYETQLTDPIPAVIGATAAPVPGAPEHLPGFRVREVTKNGAVVNLSGAFESLRNLGPTANVIDYSIDTINFSDEGENRRFDNTQYFRSNSPENPTPEDFDGDVSGLALVARTTFEITEELAGTWDFLVGADDAFELWISDAEFYAYGTRDRDGIVRDDWPHMLVTPWGSLSQWRDRAFGEYQASIDLEAGHYDLELIFNERSGSAELELSARGPGQDEFHLVGSPTGLRLVPEPGCNFLLLCVISLIAMRSGSRRTPRRVGNGFPAI